MLELYIYSAIKGFSSQWVWSAPSLDSSENCHSFIYSAVLKLWFSEGQSTYFLYSFISLSLYFTFMKSDIFLKECECGMHFHCMISLHDFTAVFSLTLFCHCHFLCNFLSVNIRAQANHGFVFHRHSDVNVLFSIHSFMAMYTWTKDADGTGYEEIERESWLAERGHSLLGSFMLWFVFFSFFLIHFVRFFFFLFETYWSVLLTITGFVTEGTTNHGLSTCNAFWYWHVLPCSPMLSVNVMLIAKHLLVV